MTRDSAALNQPDKLFTQSTISEWEFAQFRQLIYDLVGITLGDHKKQLVINRLACRLRCVGCSPAGGIRVSCIVLARQLSIYRLSEQVGKISHTMPTAGWSNCS